VDDARRIGTVHALVNSMALALNVASFVARRDGRRGLGKVEIRAAQGLDQAPI